MKLKYIIMCILTMMSIVMKAQGTQYYEVSQTPATTVEAGKMYVLRNREYPALCLEYDLASKSLAYGSATSLLGAMRPMCNYFITAGSDGFSVDCTLKNVNDDFDSPGIGEVGGGTVLSKGQRVASSEPNYFTVKVTSGELAMVSLDEYGNPRILSVNATNPAPSAQWIAYLVSKHTNHTYEPSGSDVHVCSACQHVEYHSWGSDGKCTVCGYECQHPGYSEGHCVNCGMACQHQWENLNGIYSQCSICHSTARNAASVTIDGTTSYYVSAEAAFAKAAEGTAEKPAAIKMLKDYDIAAGDYTVKVTSGVMTLDLNGYKLGHGFYGGATIRMEGGDLTIEDNSEAQTGKVANSNYPLDYKAGSLTVKGGTFITNDGSAGPNKPIGYQALHTYDAGKSYTPGSIKLRGGVFMIGNSASMAMYDSNSWDIIDLDGYCFVDIETDKFVPVPSDSYVLKKSVVVKPSDNYAPFEVTIDGVSKKYISAEAAFAKAAEGTAEKPAAIKMLNDYERAAGDYTVKVTSGVMTLDLNGYTLSHGFYGGATVRMEGGDLTIEDNSEAQTGKVANSNYPLDYKAGSLTVKGGTFITNDGSAGPNKPVGYQALHTYDAGKSYTPGSIKLRGGVFMIGNSASMMMYDSYSWDIIDLDGYCFVDIETGKLVPVPSKNSYALTKSVVVKPADNYYVASVTIDGDTQKYFSAEDAFAKAAEGTAEKPATIKLLDDCVKNSDQYYINVTSGVMTLDLNGYTLSHAFLLGATIQVDGGDLTIEDSSEAQTGKVANSEYAIKYVSGSLTINGGTFCSNDGSVPSNTSGSQTLYAIDATMPYTPGSIKLRGGVFMVNGSSASILFPYTGHVCTDLIDMDGYCFVDKETDKFVPLPTNNPNLYNSVVVKPSDNYAPFEVTINGVSKKYISAEDAFAKAAEGTAEKPATIKMLKDFNIEGGNSYLVKVESGVMTLDLNGFTLGHGYWWTSTIYMEGGDLTIEDNSEAQTGKVANAAYPIYYVSGSLTINGGTFTSNDGLSSNYSTGYMALYASDATQPYTPGSIKLRGGVFMMNHDYASILVPYNNNHEPCWDMIDIDGYCFVDKETDKFVPVPTTDSNLMKSVVVKPFDDYAPFEVTIDGVSKKYISAEEAFAKAAEGTAEKPATIKLLDDCVKNIDQYYIKVMSGVMTLDLNGHTLSHNYGGESTIHVEGGDLTIEDSSEAQTGKVANSFYAIKYVSGSLTINGGTFCSNDGSSYNTSGMYALYASAATQPYTPGSIKLRGGVFMMNYDNASIMAPENGNHEPCWDLIDLDGYYLENVTTGNRVELPENDSKLNVSVAVKKRQTPTIYIADQKIALNEESIAAFNREHTDVQLSLGEEVVNVSLNGFKYEGAPEQSGVIELMDENVSLHLIIKGENSIKLTGVTGKERLAAVMANELAISSDGTLDIDIDETCSAGQVAGIMADEGVMTYGRGIENFAGADNQLPADISEFTGTVSINNNASGSLSAGIISGMSMLFSGKFNVQTTSSSSIGIYSPVLLLCDVDMNVKSSGNAFAVMYLLTVEAELTLQGTAGVFTQVDPEEMPVMAMMRIDNYEGLNYDVKAGTSAENAQKMEYVQLGADPSQFMAIIPDGITYLHANHSIQLTEDSEVEVKNVNGIYITAQDIVIEDGKDFKVFVPFDAPRVTFKRNVKKDGKKYSFVVPFDIPAEQAAELGKFYLYDHHDDSKVYFVEATDGVSANRAYFFAPAKDIESITVEDVTISAAQIFEDSFHESYSGLYGTYSTADIPEGAYGYDVDGTFVKAGTGNKLAPFRAILWLTDEIAFEAKQLIPVFGDEDDIATGISTVATDRQSAIYNISGQRVSAPARTGLYIQNGRKVVKK